MQVRPSSNDLSLLSEEQLCAKTTGLLKELRQSHALNAKLTHENAQLKHMEFAAKSELFNVEQRSLREDDVETDMASRGGSVYDNCFMNKTIKAPGGIAVRVIETLNGFKRKYGYWPSTLTADCSLISLLATTALTPLGFFLLQSKVELVEGTEGRIVATGRDGDSFNYGIEGWQDFPVRVETGGIDARAWLGLDTDENE